MSESLFASPRYFRIWLYTVSHSTLLLRSLKGDGFTTRIDVIFKPVRYMCLPCDLHGIDVRLMSRADLGVDLGEEDWDSDKVFSLSGEERRFWVVSGTMGWHEDEGEYSDDSRFSVPRMVW